MIKEVLIHGKPAYKVAEKESSSGLPLLLMQRKRNLAFTGKSYDALSLSQ
jgi:hypothetical protein